MSIPNFYVPRSQQRGISLSGKVVEHTCPAITHDQFKGPNRQRYLQPHLEALVANERTIKPKTLGNIDRAISGNNINYKALQRARQGIIASMEDGPMTNSARKIKPFLDSVRASAFVDFSREDSESPHFERAFVLPHACVNAFLHSPQLLTFDACHFKSQTVGHILGASFLDASNHIVIMAWGVSAGNECKETWSMFFDFLRQSVLAHSNVDIGFLTSIADRGKGLVPAYSEVFPSGHLYHCIQHLAENLKSRFTVSIEKAFRILPHINDRSVFREIIRDKIQSQGAIGIQAAEYISSLDTRLWTVFDAPPGRPRFGVKTSNTMESVWGRMLEERELDHLGFLYAVWRDVGEKFYERSQAVNLHPRFTDHWCGKFAVELERSRSYVVSQLAEDEAVVDHANVVSRSSYLVNLAESSCSCLLWQDLQLPCRHAIAFLRFKQIDPETRICRAFSLESYRQAYTGRLNGIALAQLEPDDTLPPRNQPEPEERGPGRPSKRKRGVKRTRQDEQKQEETRALHRQVAEENEAGRGAIVVNRHC